MAQATSVAEIFELMPSRLNAQAAQGVNATYQFELTGDNGGTYHVKIANGACQVEQGPAGNAKCCICKTAWVDVMNGEDTCPECARNT